MNLRFWIDWLGSEVKLTLEPGQVIHLHEGHHTDEGYRSESRSYAHEGDGVKAEYYTRERDCDGLMEWNNEMYLPAGSDEWEPLESSQRDHSAEAMNY